MPKIRLKLGMLIFNLNGNAGDSFVGGMQRYFLSWLCKNVLGLCKGPNSYLYLSFAFAMSPQALLILTERCVYTRF